MTESLGGEMPSYSTPPPTDASMLHSASTWDWMKTPLFANLLAMSDRYYAPGLESIRKVVAVVDPDVTALKEFHLLGVRDKMVGYLEEHLRRLLNDLVRWNAADLASAARDGWPRQLFSVDLEGLLRVIVLRTGDRLPLFEVMEQLGRDEVLRRVRRDLSTFRIICMVG